MLSDARLRRGDFGGGDAEAIEAGGDLLAQQVDEMAGGRAGAQAQPHAGLHLGQGHGGCLSLQIFVHLALSR